ncbi:hypothetical protein BWQ96_08792 [Gracilariopsis chorda]|uniref:Uncharacterized protein n=1 Tax=Gracilariopsis chorda TaxID=448386 RepID=A0A2V3IHC0_9FLOR|nr:hypothetical protein BWQ96_10873 [Gracilariopsis chorda]PXF39848.1 hypothetical protein BWQ96_10444 [Gracilariopsis chorda]PXF41485.1 hypothetical protein BWQ96_08792 [Gracilariopsis chorda]|eukprot:PXF39441.1 hypothetical protein BWQ96_10873 [Gracilariopsis chorda]
MITVVKVITDNTPENLELVRVRMAFDMAFDVTRTKAHAMARVTRASYCSSTL